MKTLAESKVFDVVRPQNGGRTRIRITCDCGTTADHQGAKMKPDGAAVIFRNKGWKVDQNGRSAKCPRCQMGAKKTNGQDASPAAQNMVVQATLLLYEHFDKDSGRYSEGWSDARIAEEVGLADGVVISVRENNFGRLSADPEVLRIEQKLADLERRYIDDKTGLVELIKSHDKKFGDELAALKLELMEANKGRRPPAGSA